MIQNKEFKSREDFECLWHLVDFSFFICNSKGFKQSSNSFNLGNVCKANNFQIIIYSTEQNS